MSGTCDSIVASATSPTFASRRKPRFARHLEFCFRRALRDVEDDHEETRCNAHSYVRVRRVFGSV